MKNYAEQQMGAVLNPCVNHPEMSRAMPARAVELSEAVQAAIERFDEACREWGWQEEQGYVPANIHASEAEYSAARLALVEAVLIDRQRDQWRPIETAPKDGTDILVADDGRQGVEMVSWKGGAKKGGWHTEDGRASYTTDFFTHWQPLPSTPKASE